MVQKGAQKAVADHSESDGERDRLQSYRYYVARAQESIDAAKAEALPHRMHIHLEAARQWTSLAEKAAFVERRRLERAAPAQAPAQA